MVIYGLGHNDWNTFIQSILYLNRNLWLNEKNHEINCSFGYIFKTEHRCQALLAVNFPDVFLGTFLHSYVRSWDKFQEEITGFVGNLSHCCDIFLPCYHINILLTYGIGAWLSLILWGLFLHTREEHLPHPLSHLELQKHGIFPRSFSQHSQESQNFKVTESLYNSKYLQFVFKTRGSEGTLSNVKHEGRPQSWTGNTVSFNEEVVHSARESVLPKNYMEIQFPKAAEFVCNPSRGSWHGRLRILTSENCNLPKSLGGLAILKTFFGITHVSKVSSLLTARLVAWCLIRKPWKRSARK